MTIDVLEPAQTEPATKLRIVDCDIHPMTRGPKHLHPYLSERWRRHLETYGSFYRQPFFASYPVPKFTPALSRRDTWPPNGGPPGSDLAFMREQHLDPNGVDYGILQVLSPNGASQRNTEFGAALCTAVNEWQLEEWARAEPRLKASITVPQEDPVAAVAEIERRAACPEVVQVSLAPRAFNPLGQRSYWPIYEAAVRHDLPVGLHSSGYGGYPDSGSGHPSYYTEHHHSIAMTMQTLLTNLVFEGVFERFPTLRIVLVEGGFAWAPSLAWRLDRQWARMRDEVPHVTRPPSEYLRENVWFTTQPVDEPERPGQLRDVIEWIGWDRLLFSTDYPHWDYDDPRHAIAFKMEEAQRAQLFRDNAVALYGLG